MTVECSRLRRSRSSLTKCARCSVAEEHSTFIFVAFLAQSRPTSRGSHPGERHEQQNKFWSSYRRHSARINLRFILSALSARERTKDTIDHLTNPLGEYFASRRSTNWGAELLIPAFCGTGRIFSFISCFSFAWIAAYLLLEKYGKAAVWFDLYFFGQHVHFLENHSRLPGRRRHLPLTLRGWHALGALMRIGSTFIAVVAMTLVAAADVHSDGSGLAEQATPSAQPRQLAQAPAPSPPPPPPPRAHSPPWTAPPPPADAPPTPSPGTPAT